jgi:phospholipid-binding lipoprotein MlaA
MIFRLLALAAICSLAACATIPEGVKDKRDPFQSYNRAMYKFNTAVDNKALKPVALAYVRVLPQPARRSINHFFTNLSYPRTVVNDLLQGKLRDSGSDLARFVVNSVLGLGFFDPAASMGLEQHNEDFGQTFGKWGVPAGPYLVLPVLGPSTVRDTMGRVPDEYLNGRHYIKNRSLKYGLVAIDAVDTRANLLDTDTLLSSNFDNYAFMRNAWLERRNYLTHDGDVEAPDLEAGFEEPANDKAAAPPDRSTNEQ